MNQQLGKYEILSELGKGGFATVYRARDTVLGREVALKVLAPQLVHDGEWVARFFREARAAANLHHPHIATIYDIAQEGGQLAIAMHLAGGGSLAERIARDGPLPWAEALALVRQVADALDYAHGQGVLHRDLKPANILLDARLGPLLTDLGFARLVGESTLGLTLSGGVVGTPAYIAPEVWEGEAATVQTDVYALGCIVYELLAGAKAFPGSTPPAVMRAHFKPLALPERWPVGVPAGVGDVLRRALAQAPGERFASASELAAVLEAAQTGSPRLAPALAQSKPAVPAQWRRTPGGIVIAGPENIDVLVAVPDAPARLWWEKVGMELCLVPAGEFVMGSPDGTGDDNEHPQHRVYLHSYYIGRTPVTQQQYARFVMEMGGGAPCCDMDWAKPYNWDRARKTFPQGKAQHPVVLVSWHDAEAWCRWAGLRLPTEAEWEKAARGKDGRQYPWGERWEDGRCNSYESGKGGTTPMGTYSPAGDSPYGCADMAGNVLERTSSLYDPYPYDAGDGREDTATEGKRVLRGGSWYTQQEYVRSASRYGLEPTYWHLCTGGVGFRCSVSSTYSP